MAVATKSSDVPPGGMLSLTVDNVDIVLFRSKSGVLCAMEDRCSHADVRLSDGAYDGGEVVECLAHGAQFNTCSGKALCMPAVTGVRTFPCREEGDTIFIDLP